MRTLIREKAAENKEGPTISILTGDFLAPYLLSSLDKGLGMMRMLNGTPIDYVIWGNHEDDIEHKHVVKRTHEFHGTWLNTNMQDHETFEATQKAFDIVRVARPGAKVGSHARKVGLIGILSSTPALYRKSAFGGATIADPYDTMAEYKAKLEDAHGVDLVLPLCHLYVPQDHVTCERFDFPVVLSGHDHHVVDETVHGTRLLKAGADANNAVVLDISWSSADDDCKPDIDATVLRVADFAPDPELQKEVVKAQGVLEHLKRTQLCVIPDKFRPLTSLGGRARVCSAATFLWSTLRDALNSDDKDETSVDCVIISGGNIRGGREYGDRALFSMEDLESEIQEALTAVIVNVPGEVLEDAFGVTRREPNPGFLQADDLVVVDGGSGRVTSIGGAPLDRARTYRCAMNRWDLFSGSSKPIVEWAQRHRDEIPDEEAAYGVRNTLLGHFARNVWLQIAAALDADGDGSVSREELLALDADADGRVSAQEVAAAVRRLGFSADGEEESFLLKVMEQMGDKNRDGYLSGDELDGAAR